MIERNEVKEHFNSIAASYDEYKEQNSHYYRELKILIRELVETSTLDKVFEIGCGTGNLLAGIPARFSVGGDLSMEMVRRACTKWSDPGNLHFIAMAAEELPIKPVFDCILMVDLLEHVPDPGQVLIELRSCIKEESRIIILGANPLWAPVLHFAERRHLKMPEGPHRWPSMGKLKKLSRESGFVIADSGYRYILPFAIGKPGDWINHIFRYVPLLNRLCLIQYLVLHAK
jgi:ubiquinone/menaquinone biosynthesis C-methylase UbiE